MTSSRGRGIINFNPEYFSNRQKLLNTLAVGVKSHFYIKNATPVSVGAHEAGHIVEDWLIDKYNAGDVSSRVLPEMLIKEAYISLLQTYKSPDEVKQLGQLTKEISRNANVNNFSECLADAVSDLMTNRENASQLSVAIYQRLKKELD